MNYSIRVQIEIGKLIFYRAGDLATSGCFVMIWLVDLALLQAILMKKMLLKIPFFLFCFSVVLSAETTPILGEETIQKLPSTFMVYAGRYPRENSPTQLMLAPSIQDKSVKLERLVGQKRVPVPCQIIPGNPRRLVFKILRLEAGKTQTFCVSSSPILASKKQMQLKENGDHLALCYKNTKLLQYNIQPQPVPTYAKKYKCVVERTGYIHPLYTPRGEVLTATHPKDHIHHLGLWHAWTHTQYNGNEIDFWNLKKAQGTVRFVKMNWENMGSVLCGASVEQAHLVLRKKEEVALNDTFTFYSWKPDKKGYVLDYISVQSCASNKPIVLGPYRYSSFVYRGRLDWGKGNCDYLTSEGNRRENANFTTPRWCRIEGKTKTGSAGILFMSCPSNPHYPEPIRTWNKQSGMFFNINPIQQESITLKPGEFLSLTYRMYIYDGTLSAEDCETLWKDYAHPVFIKTVL